MPYFDTTDGTRLFYAEAGEAGGRTVVFAHAWALNSGMWHYQIPAALAAGMRCVVFDRRGHGRSDVPGRGYDLDRLADDLADCSPTWSCATRCWSDTPWARPRWSAL
ncbi:alpha/beta fold hydrolase [Streptomyces camelliae]|uniref:Alpha/beta fold hydrolase n=1 Tax=Streptomyces camelliae TaxID=3004093 RepID=A0ABY7PGR0_9ACTN|nr:alpha/beta fold hydrolase [Streptomyces sp. HUAS 2-6]WBO68762.1 alpha/beta fold hydrolase [Streptomyces sp. HUAS 2-6]